MCSGVINVSNQDFSIFIIMRIRPFLQIRSHISSACQKNNFYSDVIVLC